MFAKLENYKHVAFIFIMQDVLDEVQKPSSTFKKNEVAIGDVKYSLERTTLALKALLSRPGAWRKV